VSKALLDIKQIDKKAVAVNVYYKRINCSTVGDGTYAYIGSYDVKASDPSLMISVDVPKGSATIYRVIPIGKSGCVGSEYTNVVVGTTRGQRIKSFSLTAKLVDGGIQLEASKIPTDVVSVEFCVRNLTLFEKSHSNVGGTVLLITDSIREADSIITIDKNVKQHNVYEYAAKIFYRCGSVELVGHHTVEYVIQNPGKVSLSLTDLEVTNVGGYDVSFTINSSILENHHDVLKSLLTTSQQMELFQGDVEKEREFLSGLIAYKVHRINMTTGLREDFGVVTVSRFSDKLLRSNYAVEPLVSGNRYRYDVSVLMRSPETMFDKFIKSSVDEITKKSYVFSPSKFMHPINLNEGTIVTRNGAMKRFAKDEMTHGELGVVSSIEVRLQVARSHVDSANVSKFDVGTNIVSWNVVGRTTECDHFVVMKVVDGIRFIVGKAHSSFSEGGCQFIHELGTRDSGSLRYFVMPIYNDYSTGEGATSNVVIV